jgi:hypothetical protein
MELRPSLFWDTDIKTMDLQKHKQQIIERTLMRGRIDEVRALFAFYKKDVIAEVMLSARYIDKLTLALCCAIFKKPITEFRCYKLAQSNPQHWDY